MASPTRPVPDSQQRAFELAVAERLDIDPQSAWLLRWRVEDGLGYVQLSFPIDPDELLEMFNTGKAKPSPWLEARLAEARTHLAAEFRRVADPSTSGVWREACDLLDIVTSDTKPGA